MEQARDICQSTLSRVWGQGHAYVAKVILMSFANKPEWRGKFSLGYFRDLAVFIRNRENKSTKYRMQ